MSQPNWRKLAGRKHKYCSWKVGNLAGKAHVVTQRSPLGRKLAWCVMLISAQGKWQSSEKGGCCRGLWARRWSAGEAGGTLVSISNPSVGPEAVWRGFGRKEQNGVTPVPSQTDVWILLSCRLFVKLPSVLLLDMALKILWRMLCTIQIYHAMSAICLKELRYCCSIAVHVSYFIPLRSLNYRANFSCKFCNCKFLSSNFIQKTVIFSETHLLYNII